MGTPEFVLDLRAKIGHDPLWLAGVTAVVVRDGDVLLVERADNGRVTPVTGIIDPGEDPMTAGIREVSEEAGITAKPEALVWVHALPPMTYPNGDQSQYLDIVVRCRADGGDPHPADGENTRAWWCPVSELDAAGLDPDMRERIRVALEHEGSARFTA
ncbi:NUDIX domain-containing protein [Microbacterium sp. ZXX196]|uniref:NUDIX hydrolase n=1 Tax=Microbacterium sp. ZXX196 TaxID=2609291 RepID=UPI0013283D30|nr:NUDIX domain-containing protein [Microbacterium sp. ZXX196]MTE22863.1 NUDIX domain-containing protein [Microbacterium sp. ZXX196]